MMAVRPGTRSGLPFATLSHCVREWREKHAPEALAPATKVSTRPTAAVVLDLHEARRRGARTADELAAAASNEQRDLPRFLRALEQTGRAVERTSNRRTGEVTYRLARAARGRRRRAREILDQECF